MGFYAPQEVLREEIDNCNIQFFILYLRCLRETGIGWQETVGFPINPGKQLQLGK